MPVPMLRARAMARKQAAGTRESAPEPRVPGRVTQAVAVPSPWIDRSAEIVGNALTPARLTEILSERALGYMRPWIDLANEMRRNNPHLSSQLSIREESVVETEFEIVPGEGTNQQAARYAASQCRELFQHWKQAGWENWLAELVAGKYYGRSLHEVIWETDGTDILPVRLERIDERRLSYACDRFDPNPWDLRIWDYEEITGPFTGVYGRRVADFHPDKFLINEPRVLGGPKTTEGLFSAVVWYTLFHTWSWRDLMALNEMIGRPPVVAYYAAGGGQGTKQDQFSNVRMAVPQEVEAGKQAVFNLSGSLRAVLPDTIRLEALHFQIPTGEPMQLLSAREANALISKAITGVANLSDLQPGARAAVEAQERVSSTFWRSDCRMVEKLVGELFRRIIAANPQRFPATTPIPKLCAKTDPPVDVKAIADGLTVAKALGLEIPVAWAHRALQIPVPDVDRDGVKEPVLESEPVEPTDNEADEAPSSDAPPTDTPQEPKAKES